MLGRGGVTRAVSRGAIPAVVLALLVGACTSSAPAERIPPGSTSAAGSATASPPQNSPPQNSPPQSSSPQPPPPAIGSPAPTASGPVAFPPAFTTRRAAPRPDRPVVALAFDTTRWRTGTVTGTERVRFTPDLRVCELVFRLWVDKPEIATRGGRITLGAVTVDGRSVQPALESAGGPAGAPTLAALPLPGCVGRGTTLIAQLAFTVTVAAGLPERVSRNDDAVWLGTAYPLLAWEHGVGWMRDPAVPLVGEMAGSEAYRLASLEVSAAGSDLVQGAGAPAGRREGPGGVTVSTFRAEAVRDVVVVVGALHVTARDVGRVHVHVATLGTPVMPAAKWAESTARAMTSLVATFGPFPYDDVWISVLPGIGGGIEFPGAILVSDLSDRVFPQVLPHELAHAYFYGLVGNDQGRDPWLDEAFATYAEALVNGDGSDYQAPEDPAVRGHLGAPMTYWSGLPQAVRAYVAGVYAQGARALLDARAAAGPAIFDAVIRRYLEAHAQRVARPADLEAALRPLPGALAVLRAAGAFGDVAARA